MRESKRRLERLSFYDHSGIAEHLENMALRGWMVERPGNWIWRYKRIEPRKLRFAVTYFPDALSLRKDPAIDQETMEELCRRDGWILAARWGQMQIFYNEQEDPVPIETDPVITVDTIHRAMRKGTVNAAVESMFFALVLCGGLVYQFVKAPVSFLADPFELLFFLGWALMAIGNLVQILLYHNWHRKAVRDAEEGLLRPVRWDNTLSKCFGFVSSVAILLSFLTRPSTRVALLIGIAVVLIPISVDMLYTRAMQKRGVPRAVVVKRGLTLMMSLFLLGMVGMTWYIVKIGLPTDSAVVGTDYRYGRELKVYADELPLRLEDLVDVGEARWSAQAQKKESPFVSYTEYRQLELGDGELQRLEYTVTDVKVPALYPFCKDNLLSARKDERGFINHYEAIDPTPWQAEAAYQLHFSSSVLDQYLLCYEDRIVDLMLYFTPDREEMAIIAEKLGGNRGEP